ncbi:MAG TPA: endonuclease/exonuclease/phosphatase family protein [Candidatus Binataceae bacterium]|nr:endonuclease/exonuclease/phosphatase family protein [Candidatus Binataceae bacterium]
MKVSSHQSQPYAPNRETDAMTYNVYFGADLTPILTAGDFNDLLIATTAAWQQVVASDIPDRAAAIADEIAANSPALVGLQEVAQWSVGATPGTTEVRYDFLEFIQNRLAEDGAHYAAVAVQPDLDATAPMLDGTNVVYARILDRDVMLARTDLPASALKISNLNSASYSNQLMFTTLLGPVTVPRSYIAADVKVRGKSFRFITTHLETFSAAINFAQGQELIAGPANTALPVVAVGDYNSSANGGADTTPTYGAMLDAGFEDAWEVLNPTTPGNTCCQAQDLGNATSELYERIDLVMVRGGMDPRASSVVTTEGSALPYWPSDHAGVAATLRIPTQTPR